MDTYEPPSILFSWGGWWAERGSVVEKEVSHKLATVRSKTEHLGIFFIFFSKYFLDV